MASMSATLAHPGVAPQVHEFLRGRTRRMLIDGKWVEAKSGKTFVTVDPSTGQSLAEVPAGDKEDIDLAVRAARRAFDSGPWSTMSPSQRGRCIWKLADLIEQHTEEFAQLETLDNGKPISVSRVADVPLVVDHFRYYAGWATKVEGETIPVSFPGQYFVHTLREPVGVVGQIIPWNFPLLMAAWKLGVALACGNTVVLKPAEQTPLSALRLGELFDEAGIPPGVVNIVTGMGETAGAALAEHPGVDKVAFTGSTDVGRIVMRAAAGNLKRVSLELGGKSPNIIFADSDLDTAAAGAAHAIYFNHGQCCCAGSRLFIEHKAFDNVMSRLVSMSEKIKIGPGMDAATEMGPLVSQEQLERVSGFFESGRKEGARIATGGGRPKGVNDTGYFVSPTVLTEVKPDMRVLREEIFGPVVCAIPFKDPEDVVAAGNDSDFGLAAAVWTRDVGKAHRLASRLRAGTVWVNCYNCFDAAAPFGGYKQSGFGREMGKAALEMYTQIKTVWVNTGV